MNYKSISLISGTLLLSTLSANGQKKGFQTQHYIYPL